MSPGLLQIMNGFFFLLLFDFFFIFSFSFPAVLDMLVGHPICQINIHLFCSLSVLPVSPFIIIIFFLSISFLVSCPLLCTLFSLSHVAQH